VHFEVVVLVNLRDPSQGVLQLVRFKAEGSGLALVCHAAGGVDQVKPIRPAGVRLFGRVAEFIEHGGDLYPQFPHACSGDECAFLFAFWAGKNNIVFDIALHLPNIARVCLGDVDDQECDSPGVLLVELVKGRNLPPERWSSVASEYEDDRLSLSGKP